MSKDKSLRLFRMVTARLLGWGITGETITDKIIMKTKLIHALIIAIACFCVMPAVAQTAVSKSDKKFEKIITKAIKKGRDSYGAYHTKVKYNDRKAFWQYLVQKKEMSL